MRPIILAAALTLGATAALAQETISAPIIDVEGNEIGTATVMQTPTGIVIEARADGISPGEHGFHVHETGACEPETEFQSAGGHLAGDMKHGFLVEGGPHPGDMANVHVQDDGVLHVEVFNDRISIGGDDGGRLDDADGAALMVHSGPDDYESQPSGDAGSRVACAVIFPN